MQLSVRMKTPTELKPSLLDTLPVWLNTALTFAYNHWFGRSPIRPSSKAARYGRCPALLPVARAAPSTPGSMRSSSA